MTAKLVAGAALVALAFLFAGCVGSFEVQQTEPIKVQLDGAPQNAQVGESDSEPQTFIVENDVQAENISVEVEVTKLSDEACTVLVTVQDGSTNETLLTKEVTVGGTNQTSPTPTGNGTTNSTSPSPMPSNGTEGDTTVVENIFVNVKGKDNIVVIMEAQSGEATVNVAARNADGNTQGGGNVTAPPTYSP